jgi:shikimate kinase
MGKSDGDSFFCSQPRKMVSMTKFEIIYLTGFRGTGKTSIGTLLAKSLGRTVIDLDGVVAANAGKSIREIFQQDGESSFRDLETTALESVAQTSNSVISLGGGAVLRDINRSIIQSTGICFWLQCDAETIAERLQQDEATGDQRPALTKLDELQEIRQLLQTRQAKYEDVADHRINTKGRSIEQVAEAILERLTQDRAS